MSAGWGLGWGRAWVLEDWAHCGLVGGPRITLLPGTADTFPHQGPALRPPSPSLPSPWPFLTPSSGYRAHLASQPPAAGLLRGWLALTCGLTPSPGLLAGLRPCLLQPRPRGDRLCSLTLFQSLFFPLSLILSACHASHPSRSVSPGNVFPFWNLHFMCLLGLALALSNLFLLTASPALSWCVSADLCLRLPLLPLSLETPLSLLSLFWEDPMPRLALSALPSVPCLLCLCLCSPVCLSNSGLGGCLPPLTFLLSSPDPLLVLSPPSLTPLATAPLHGPLCLFYGDLPPTPILSSHFSIPLPGLWFPFLPSLWGLQALGMTAPSKVL